ncbi:hypothetical protein SAMN02910456_02331 [Ruminococcaceae bacterium YRB3002]|nr:hypothetical protein SAMN02910456_02331 [Ruminococcaceae bacterium YRB3002]
MNRKTLSIILSCIPIISAVIFFALLAVDITFPAIGAVRIVTMLLALMGGVVFAVGRVLAKDSKAVLVLGIFDLLSNISIIGLYVVAIFSFGL